MNPVSTITFRKVKNCFDQYIKAVNSGNYILVREMLSESYQHFYSKYRITLRDSNCNLTKYQFMGLIQHCVEEEVIPLRLLNESWIKGTGKILFRGMGYYAFHSKDTPQLITQVWEPNRNTGDYRLVLETVISQ